MNLRGNGEILLKAIFAVGGLLIIIESLHLGFGTMQRPGPGLFPLLCGFLILLQSVILFFRRNGDHLHKESQYNVGKLLAIIVTFVLWIVLMPFLGYVVTTFLSALSFAKAMGLEGWRKPLLLSCGISVFCYALFDLYLYIDLPRDFLGVEGVLSTWNIL